MGRQIYQEDEFKVYRVGNSFIVHNSKYQFNDKHTHIFNLGIAKKVIYYTKKNIVPRTFNPYLLTSLIRLSDDTRYINEIEALITVRAQKGKKPKYVRASYA